MNQPKAPEAEMWLERVREARAEAFEEAAKLALEVPNFHGPAGIPKRTHDEIMELAAQAREPSPPKRGNLDGSTLPEIT